MRTLRLGDAEFPRELLLLDEPPEAIHLQGDVALLKRPMVAIVGSRHPSPYGVGIATDAARALAQAGAVVVSGMARGLDARAHRGALDAGGGTIGVLGTGLDVVYPPGNRDLFDAVARQGLLLTEFGPGVPAHKWNFPRRNRLIAALARCLIVVEGAAAGGTGNTAAWALKMNRPIWAVPGRLGDPQAEGPNRLIGDGAHIYLGPDDVLSLLGLAVPPPADRPLRLLGHEGARRRAELSGAEATLFDLITPRPVHVDDLATRCDLAPGLLLAALSSLELQGLVTQLPGKHFALAS